MFDLSPHRVVSGNNITSSIHNSSLNAFLVIGDFIQVSPTYSPGTSHVCQIIDISALEDISIAEIGRHDHEHWKRLLGTSYSLCLVQVWMPADTTLPFYVAPVLNERASLHNIREVVKSRKIFWCCGEEITDIT